MDKMNEVNNLVIPDTSIFQMSNLSVCIEACYPWLLPFSFEMKSENLVRSCWFELKWFRCLVNLYSIFSWHKNTVLYLYCTQFIHPVLFCKPTTAKRTFNNFSHMRDFSLEHLTIPNHRLHSNGTADLLLWLATPEILVLFQERLKFLIMVKDQLG